MIAEFQGEVAALGAAMIWAIAAVIYTQVGQHLSPLVLNLIKGLMAIGLLILTLVLVGELLPQVSLQTFSLLALSGVLGIGLGDTAYFAALNCLGPRRALILESLAPPLAALLALVFLHEQLAVQAWIGIGLTVGGVAWVVLEQTSVLPNFRARPMRGAMCGVFAAIAQAGGAVLSRAALANTEVAPLWSTFVRLAAGILVLLGWLLIQHRSVEFRAQFKPLTSWRLLSIIACTAFASTYLGIWLQQISLKYAPVGVAQALTATSPLFVIPVAAIVLHERVSRQAIWGSLLALGGVWLLFSR